MEQLKQLISEICNHPPNSLERRRKLNQLIHKIQKSGKIWRGEANISDFRQNNPEYQDALQKTWIFLVRNLCTSYNPDVASVTTWLNRYLKWRLHDLRQDELIDGKSKVVVKKVGDNKTVDIVNTLPANPDIPPILENTLKWAQQDKSGELRRIHIKGHPQVTCQKLILRRLPPETSWKELSEEFGLSISTLSNFYRRECMPRLRNFGKSEGYID